MLGTSRGDFFDFSRRRAVSILRSNKSVIDMKQLPLYCGNCEDFLGEFFHCKFFLYDNNLSVKGINESNI